MSWGRRSRRSSRYSGFAPYVPVAERRAKAQRETEKMKKKGQDIQPVEIEGRTIARSFWGKGWCTHLESFGDYSNRLPRGRTYVRNGSVCHLGIEKGKVTAMVSGSSLYKVTVDVTPLKAPAWQTLKKRCTGKIGSLIELLQGNLSDEIMKAVVDREHGLFPKPGEIRYGCNCPDWADMCKHVSAVMYGIGARLDTQPELLFLLRGVEHEELITTDAATDAIVGTGSSRSRRRTLAGEELKNVFGVDLDDASEAIPAAAPKRRPAKRTGAAKKIATKARKPPAKKVVEFKPTARAVAKLRAQLGMNKTQFAEAVGVSAATVTNWEKARGKITPHASGLAGLKRLHHRSQ